MFEYLAPCCKIQIQGIFHMKYPRKDLVVLGTLYMLMLHMRAREVTQVHCAKHRRLMKRVTNKKFELRILYSLFYLCYHLVKQ